MDWGSLVSRECFQVDELFLQNTNLQSCKVDASGELWRLLEDRT